MATSQETAQPGGLVGWGGNPTQAGVLIVRPGPEMTGGGSALPGGPKGTYGMRGELKKVPNDCHDCLWPPLSVTPFHSSCKGGCPPVRKLGGQGLFGGLREEGGGLKGVGE